MNRKAALRATKDLSKAAGAGVALIFAAILISFGLVNCPLTSGAVVVIGFFSFLWWVFYNDAKRYS